MLGRHLGRVAVVRDAGVVDQDVNAVPVVEHVGNGGRDLVGLADVALTAEHFDPGLPGLGHGLGQALRVEIDQIQVDFFGRQTQGNRPTDARGHTGDQGLFTADISHDDDKKGLRTSDGRIERIVIPQSEIRNPQFSITQPCEP